MATSKNTAEAPPAASEVAPLPRVDEAIVVVERLYQAITGSPPPATPADEPLTPLPVEKDAAEFITERLDRLLDAIDEITALGQPSPAGQPAGGHDQRNPRNPQGRQARQDHRGREAQQGLAGQPGAAGLPAAVAAWSPPLTCYEDGDGLLLQLEVPGVHRQDLQLSHDGDSLTIAGKRTPENGGKRLRLTERPLGTFWRRIILPRGTGAGEINASLRDGVLEVRIPKPKEGTATHRPISIS
jgi:HSP20 family protein